MNKDLKAEYLASGSGEGAPESLESVRRVLGDPTTWVTPPPSVAEGVLAEIRAATSPFRGAPRRPTWRRFALAAAGVTGMILLIALLGQLGQGTGIEVALAGTELQPDATGLAVMEATNAGWSIGLDVDGLPPAADGYYYEGWVWSDEGDGVSIGTFHLRNGSESLQLWSGVDVAGYPSIWISLEPEDGDPGVSEEIVMMGRVELPADDG